MTVLIIIALIAAVIAYYITKSRAHLSSIEDSVKNAIEKIELTAAPAIEEVEEIVTKAAKASPKNKIIATAVEDIKKVKTAAKKVTTKKQK
jgi:cytoskeletal protein RodZ